MGKKLKFLLIITLTTASIGSLSGCSVSCLDFIIPSPIAYPEPGWDFNKIVNETMQRSNDLDAYIRAYLDGNVEGNIPRTLLPDGADPNAFPLDSFYIVKGNDATSFSKRQMIYLQEYMQDPNRPGRLTDPNACIGLFRTGQATYIGLWSLWMPFNHKYVVKGTFPYCRFFNIQISNTFEPYVYTFHNYCGPAENSIVDADIEPDPGSVNPFRIGENRNATNRNYTVTCVMKAGRTIDFDPNYTVRPPFYRGTGNIRYGAGMTYQGPYGDPNNAVTGIVSYGRWNFAQLWIRYYSPTKATAPWAGAFDPNGVSPRVIMYTPQNEPYYIHCDDSRVLQSVNTTIPIVTTDPVDVPFSYINTDDKNGTAWWAGAGKMFDIACSGFAAMAQSWIANGGNLPSPYTNAEWKKYSRDMTLGVNGKGESQPDIGRWETSTSCVNYYSLFGRKFNLGSDKVYVVTGKLPTYQPSRNGESNNVSAQCRMWIFDLYQDYMNFTDNKELGLNTECLMDDETIIDANRKYVIVVSTKENRPSNAYSANGVSWLDCYGNRSAISWRLRWVSVAPEWYMSPSVHQDMLDWETMPASACYDPNKIGYNRHDRHLGWYFPKSHCMTRPEFEQLGSVVNPSMVHTWRVNDANDACNGQWMKPYGWTEVYSDANAVGTDANIILSNVDGRYVMFECLNTNADNIVVREMQVFDSANTNIALNRPVRASCYVDDYWLHDYPWQAVDGSVDYSWASTKKYSWIYIDLGEKRSISKLCLFFDTGWMCKYPQSFKIHVADELY